MNLKKKVSAGVLAVCLAAGLVPGNASASPSPEVPVPAELKYLQHEFNNLNLPAPPQFPDAPDLTEKFKVGPGRQGPIPLPTPPAAPGPVNPHVRESYVSFGDSLAANPTALDTAMTRAKKKNPNLYWPTLENKNTNCAQGSNRFPVEAAEKTGLRLEDYSCGGATAYVGQNSRSTFLHDTLGGQVDRAINDGALNGDTQLVSISIGVNDLWQPGNYDNVGQEGRNAKFRKAVGGALQRIKAAAPNAKVVMLGLPDQTDGANHTCATNLLGMVSHWYFPIVSYYQDELRNIQRAVSQENGVEYLDMVAEINLARGNNGCSTSPNRLSAAIFDDAPHNFTFHLTDAGLTYYANRLAQTYNA